MTFQKLKKIYLFIYYLSVCMHVHACVLYGGQMIPCGHGSFLLFVGPGNWTPEAKLVQ